MTYRVIEDGNHVVFVVQGATLPELFEHAALAVFDVSFAIDRVRVDRDVPVMAVGDSPDTLLNDWLLQVLSAAAEHDIVVTTAAVDRLETGGTQGAVGGYRRAAGVVRRFVPRRARTQNAIVDVPGGHWVRILIEP